MSNIKCHPDMPAGAYTGKFHIVDNKTGFSCQSEATMESAELALADYNAHEERCERRRAADPTIPRRERKTYHIETEE